MKTAILLFMGFLIVTAFFIFLINTVIPQLMAKDPVAAMYTLIVLLLMYSMSGFLIVYITIKKKLL